MYEFAQYQQSDDILERMQEVPLVGVVGPTNAGKTTLMEYAQAQDPMLHLVVSDTSRPPRDQEIDGQQYYFRTLASMEQVARNGDYATVAPSSTGDLYATSPDEYDQYGRPMMAILSSAMPMFRRVFPNMLTIVVLPPSYDIWIDRMANRNKREARMAEAAESLSFALKDKQSVYVVNDDLEAAQADFMTLMHGEISPRIEVRQRQAKQIASSLLRRLK